MFQVGRVPYLVTRSNTTNSGMIAENSKKKLLRYQKSIILLIHSKSFCVVAATYNLSIKVGDVKGSGTDGNVYIQLFGERGNTAKIQLRQAGDTRNKFEKGRTYKFTVDTVDIGKVLQVAILR